MTFQNDYSILFQPLPLRSLTLRNRIVAPPMVTKRDITGADGIEWYARLARGGVGLVIIEATPVNWFESRLSVSSLHILADAEWPRKVREGKVKEIVKCIKCNEKCHGNLSKGLPIECTQWVRF